LSLVVPWSERRFNYTTKLAALPAMGELLLDGQRYLLGSDTTLASIDFTRGLWPYRSAWRWASAAGYSGGRRLGLNFGDGWTDGTGMLENALFVDGRVQPLWEPVRFAFDPQHIERPWTVRSVDSDRVRLTFTPSFSRAQQTNLVAVRLRLEQVMGHFSGQVRLDDGQQLELSGIAGLAENHLARW
jgi:hypothetical protein